MCPGGEMNQLLHICRMILITAIITSSLPVFANDCNQTGDCYLEADPMVVSATRWETNGIPTASDIHVITREQIVRSGADTLIEVLKGQGGLQVQDLFGNGSRATVDMRGFGSTGGANTLILIDGRRINHTDLATPNLGFIFLKDVERIEITRGTATVLFGDQAVGGVINIITRRADELELAAGYSFGSFDLRAEKLYAANRLANGLGIRASAERRRTDGFRNNNKQDIRNGFVNLSYEHARGRIFAEIQRTDEDLRIPGPLFANELAVSRKQSTRPADFNETLSDVIRLGGEWSITPVWDIAADYSLRNDDIDGALTAFGAITPFSQKRLARSFNPRLRGRWPLNNGIMTLVAGADVEETDYSLVSPLGTQDTSQAVQSLYALVTVPLSPAIAVTGGIRKAWQETSLIDFFRFFPGDKLEDNQTAGTIGITVTPVENWRLFFKREDNYRFPLVDEETSVFGSPDTLKTQTGISYEFGLEWHNLWLNQTITAYRLDLEDEIIFNSVTFQNINLPPTRRKGIIYNLSASPVNNLDINAQYTYTHAEFDAGTFAGNRIPLVAKHQLQVSASYRFLSYWQLYAETFLISDRVAGNDFADTFPDLPGYGVTNFNLRFEKTHFTVTVQLNNIFNKEYSDSAAVGLNAFFVNEVGFFPAPERNFMVTAGMRF